MFSWYSLSSLITVSQIIHNISLFVFLKNLPAKNKNTDILMLYDRFDYNAELITDESGEHDKQSYFYSTNELLTVDGKTQQQKY
jgi:hypothetical protein